jgi:hypothetical protein
LAFSQARKMKKNIQEGETLPGSRIFREFFDSIQRKEFVGFRPPPPCHGIWRI